MSALYIDLINNKILLYSTENYIKCPMINCNEKEYIKMHTCITESLCFRAEINIVNIYLNKNTDF